jgi:hypothetical protein
MCSRDHLERFVMSRIADCAFATVEVPEDDALLTRRMKLLSFLEPEVGTTYANTEGAEFLLDLCMCRSWTSSLRCAMIWCGLSR